MKITRIGPSFPLLTASTLGGGGGSVTPSVGSGLVPVSGGSNSWAWGSNVQWVTANGSNILQGPFVNFASGSNVTFSVASNTLTINASSGGSTAAGVSIADAGNFFTATDVENALQELAKKDIGYTAHGNTGATETFDALTAWHSATLNAATVTATFTGATSGLVASMVLELAQDATGGRLVTWPGSVVWPGGVAPTLSTAANAVDVLTFFSRDGGTTWFGFPTGGSSTTSPLTTKGDLYAYSTTNARLAVGSNGTAPIADSSQALGIRYSRAAMVGEVLVLDTPAGSPLVFADLIQNEAQDDLLYEDM